MSFFKKLNRSLQEVIEYERGNLVLHETLYEQTFPDCPTCGNWFHEDCPYKKQCYTKIDSDGVRIGLPLCYKEVYGE